MVLAICARNPSGVTAGSCCLLFSMVLGLWKRVFDGDRVLLVIRVAVDMAADQEMVDMENLGSRFGAKLRFSDKELSGIKIDWQAMDGVLLGFQCTMVTKVLTSNEVHEESLIDCFTPLWRGREGVSIRDIDGRSTFCGTI